MFEHPATAIASLEYKSLREIKEIEPQWIKEKQLLPYYNSMNRFFSESLDEMRLPKNFDKNQLHNFLMKSLKKYLNENEDFRNLIIDLQRNYPTFPLDASRAQNYVRLLKKLSYYIAMIGLKVNKIEGLQSLKSDISYSVFSNLILGNHTISYFHAYRAKATEEYFRHNLFMIKGMRAHLKSRRVALKNYFEVMEQTQDMFQAMLKAHFKLWMLIRLCNSSDFKEFVMGPEFLNLEKIDLDQFKDFYAEYTQKLEVCRRYLFQLDPTMFESMSSIDEPTRVMWRDMVLLEIIK